MSRIYKQLNCGCQVSCDEGGGLYPCEHHCLYEQNFDDPLGKYFRQHKTKNGYCRICHPNEYKKEIEDERRRKR